jgi:DNA-binding CsgD family transcriptional regulator
MQLALSADVSTRHIGFLESGRAKPSARMVARLALTLGLSPTEEDQLLLAAGYAPRHQLSPAGGLSNSSRIGADRVALDSFEVALVLQRVSSAADAFKVAGAHLAKLGLDYFYAARLHLLENGPPEVLFHDGGRPPLAWLAHYRERGYRKDDPLVREAARASSSFTWEDVLARSRPRSLRERRIFSEATDFRINAGIVIPLRMADGSVRAVSSMAERFDENPNLRLSSRIAGIALLEALERLGADALPRRLRPALDPQSADFLRWTRQGRSPDWLAQRYAIPIDEVERRLMTVCRSLGATDLVQAILRAEEYGLLGSG